MTIRDLYDQAELALAAYANLFAGISGGDYVRALEIADMSSSQAAQFSERWLVLDQYTHTELIPVLDEFNQPTGEYTTSRNGL